MPELLTLSDLAKKFDVSLAHVSRMAKQGKLVVVAEDDSGSGRPKKMVELDQAEAAFGLMQQDREFREEHSDDARRDRFIEAHANGRPLDGTPIRLRMAARKYAGYGVSHQLIGQWAAKGEVHPFSYRDDGNVESIDEASLWDRLQTYKPKGKGRRRRQSNGNRPHGSRPLESAAQPSRVAPPRVGGATLTGRSPNRRGESFLVHTCPHCGGRF